MAQPSATMSRVELETAISKSVRYPHKDIHQGELMISPEVYQTPGRETNLVISPFSIIDCTGSIHIGPWCNIGHRSRIYTHDTVHLGRQPLALIEEDIGVLWQDKYIGADVWIHDAAIVLYQVTQIPDGAVLGAGSVLTRNPGPYEIWAGVPAAKIGERKPMERDQIARWVGADRFSLREFLK